MNRTNNEKQTWDETKQLFQGFKVTFGEHWSYNFKNDPKRLGFVLSRYKFAAKMSCRKGSSVLELGCSDGIGATILGEQAARYVGVDLDLSAIQAAQKNLDPPRYDFIFDDFMGKKYGSFDSVVSLDVIEHIHKEHIAQYFDTVYDNLSENGVCVIGTPNITSAPYASKTSQLGHVNLYSQERLCEELREFFHIVLPFGMNDEILHTGYAPMSHYLFALGCSKRSR